MVAARLFEQTVPIAKTAVIGLHGMQLTGGQMDRLQRVKQFAQFNAIGTDILNRCRTGQARNKGQVLQAVPALFKSVQHQLMPVFTSTDVNIALLAQL